jgi:hypothetical protein
VENKELDQLLCAQIVDTCISVYNTVQTQLLPTPAKSHYTFNLRDLSKVFQGMLMASPSHFSVSPAYFVTPHSMLFDVNDAFLFLFWCSLPTSTCQQICYVFMFWEIGPSVKRELEFGLA